MISRYGIDYDKAEFSRTLVFLWFPTLMHDNSICWLKQVYRERYTGFFLGDMVTNNEYYSKEDMMMKILQS
jgi:hypothetical protein